MKVRYFVNGVDILSDDTTVVCQSTSYWFVVAETQYIPEFDHDGEVLLAIPKHQAPVAVHENSGDDPPEIYKYFTDNYVADIRFLYPSLDLYN